MGCLVGTGFLLCWEGGEEVHLIISNNLILLKYSHQRSFVSVFCKLNFPIINSAPNQVNYREIELEKDRNTAALMRIF